MQTIELPTTQEEVGPAVEKLRLGIKRLEAEIAMLRAQCTIIREQICTHPDMYVRSYYDGSTSNVCPLCGLSA